MQTVLLIALLAAGAGAQAPTKEVLMPASGGLGSVVWIPVLAVGSLWAQAEAVNARLAGTVLDANEAVIPQARVTLLSAATGFSRYFTTSDDGRYVFTLIPPGNFQLKVEKGGFNIYVQ